LTTLDVKCGAIGLDCNVDHLAVTETDAFGNLLHLPNVFRAKRLSVFRREAIHHAITARESEDARVTA
jgi:hypothetical protein